MCRILTLLWAVEDTWTSYTNTNVCWLLMDYSWSAFTQALKTLLFWSLGTHGIAQPFTNAAIVNSKKLLLNPFVWKHASLLMYLLVSTILYNESYSLYMYVDVRIQYFLKMATRLYKWSSAECSMFLTTQFALVKIKIHMHLSVTKQQILSASQPWHGISRQK